MVNPIHKSSPRSFLRFGRSSVTQPVVKRRDNFLRFGKRNSQEAFENCEQFGSFLVCKLQPSYRPKKASRDFLRFG